jgi:antitoxin (DNA-binding transcriptional repressor) of toxin-antitoxin stability system
VVAAIVATTDRRKSTALNAAASLEAAVPTQAFSVVVTDEWPSRREIR